MELVLDLLGSRVLSRWRLESSKLEPTPESEQEMHRDLRLKMEQIFIHQSFKSIALSKKVKV